MTGSAPADPAVDWWALGPVHRAHASGALLLLLLEFLPARRRAATAPPLLSLLTLVAAGAWRVLARDDASARCSRACSCTTASRCSSRCCSAAIGVLGVLLVVGLREAHAASTTAEYYALLLARDRWA